MTYKLPISNELLLRLRWTAILHGRVPADIAITGGVHSAKDVVKSMMSGAKVTQMASVLLSQGPGYLIKLKKLVCLNYLYPELRVELDLLNWCSQIVVLGCQLTLKIPHLL